MVVESAVDIARREGRTVLTEVESKEFLVPSGVPIEQARLATSGRQAAAIAKELGFPVAVKIVAPEITHKSDVGGVKLGLNSLADVRRAYGEAVAAAGKVGDPARIQGVAVQRMAPAGLEVILGMTRDAQFGPVMMFGLGGVMVEVLKDVAFRLAPLSERDASEMVRQIQGYAIMEGFRGQAAVDVAAVELALISLSNFIQEHTEVHEVDLNPVFVYPKGVLAVDARVILEEAA